MDFSGSYLPHTASSLQARFCTCSESPIWRSALQRSGSSVNDRSEPFV